MIKFFRYIERNRRYLTLKKIFNILAVNIQYWFRTDRVLGYPYIVKIEATNVCNSNCRLCPTGQGFISRQRGLMGLEGFRKIIDRLKEYIFVLDLSNWGDPLLNPDIYKMINYAHSNRICTYMSTNLHAFKKEDIQDMLFCGLDLLAISLHGVSQKTYQIYQPGKDFSQVMVKLQLLAKQLKQNPRAGLKIILYLVVTKYNEAEIPEFRKLAEGLGVDFALIGPSLNLRFAGQDEDMGSLDTDDAQRKNWIRNRMDEWLPLNDKYINKYYRSLQMGSKPGVDGEKIIRCDWPWRKAAINWDGGVSVCCGVYNKGSDLGNVFQEPLCKIWNNRMYQLCRVSFKKRKGEDKGKEGVICDNCPGFMP